MGGRIEIKLFILVVCLIMHSFSYCQEWGGEDDRSIWSNWQVSVNGGVTSFFGDLSIYDSDVFRKINLESHGAWSIVCVKSLFTNKVSLGGQFLVGNLQGSKKSIAFMSEVYEYNFHLKFDFSELWFNGKPHLLGIAGFGGIGQFFFKASRFNYSEGLTQKITDRSHVPEFVFFFGGSVYYRISPSIALNAELSLHQCRTDRLDNLAQGKRFDYFSNLEAGIFYYIRSLKKTPLRNKARIANSNFQFKK
jgi:hypothetical protein